MNKQLVAMRLTEVLGTPVVVGLHKIIEDIFEDQEYQEQEGFVKVPVKVPSQVLDEDGNPVMKEILVDKANMVTKTRRVLVSQKHVNLGERYTYYTGEDGAQIEHVCTAKQVADAEAWVKANPPKKIINEEEVIAEAIRSKLTKEDLDTARTRLERRT